MGVITNWNNRNTSGAAINRQMTRCWTIAREGASKAGDGWKCLWGGRRTGLNAADAE
jgi:hypothetical protein